MEHIVENTIVEEIIKKGVFHEKISKYVQALFGNRYFCGGYLTRRRSDCQTN